MQGLYARILEQTQKVSLTGKGLGELLGLKKSPMTDWKNGKSNPTLEQFARMCDIFAISADYLLFGNSSNIASFSNNVTIEKSNEQENILLNSFRALSADDQDEVLEIIEMKLSRAKLKGVTKSEISNITKDA